MNELFLVSLTLLYYYFDVVLLAFPTIVKPNLNGNDEIQENIECHTVCFTPPRDVNHDDSESHTIANTTECFELSSDNITQPTCVFCDKKENYIKLLTVERNKAQEECRQLLEVIEFLSKQLESVSKELQNSKKQVELQRVSFNKFKETVLSPSQFEKKNEKCFKENLKLKSDRFNNRETKKSSMD